MLVSTRLHHIEVLAWGLQAIMAIQASKTKLQRQVRGWEDTVVEGSTVVQELR